MKTFTIIKELVPMFEEKMNKLLKKFQKYGICEYTKSEPYVCEDEHSSKFGYNVVDINIDIHYQIEGYKFIASCEWLDEIGENLIKKPNDLVKVPSIYKTRRECDHCNSNRNRKRTVILKKDDQFIQVGTACCKDYIGVDLGNYANYLSFFDDLEEYELECMKKNSSRINPMYTVDFALNQVIGLTKQYGYISKKQSWEKGGDSTAGQLWFLLNKSRDIKTGDLLYPEYKITQDLEIQAKEVKQFYSNYNGEANDFIDNIKSILKLTWIDGSQVGLVAASVGTKLRLEAEKIAREAKIPSEYVGNVGDKIKFTTKATCVYSTETRYGMLYMYRMLFDNNEIIWSTSKDIDCDTDIIVTGTIKAHNEFRGVKQTEITRAKVISAA